jgi:hypothetical protein
MPRLDRSVSLLYHPRFDFFYLAIQLAVGQHQGRGVSPFSLLLLNRHVQLRTPKVEQLLHLLGRHVVLELEEACFTFSTSKADGCAGVGDDYFKDEARLFHGAP